MQRRHDLLRFCFSFILIDQVWSLKYCDFTFYRCKLSGLIATACGDDKIRVFKESSNSSKHEPSFELVGIACDGHSQDVNAVAWNPKDMGLLASCSDDSTIKLWRCINE